MPKVLLIDDDPHLRNILSRVLNKHDFEVISAEDGAGGLRLAGQERPDLIILDLMMPGMDGLEVAQRLHRDPACANIPIMILTAFATAYGRKTAVEIGIDDFVTKPFGIEDILAKVRAMTGASPPATPPRAERPVSTGQARLIGLHSLRGGLGCTSLAISLAATLKKLWERPTLLLDADFANGQVALALNWPDALSWSDLMQATLDNTIRRLLDEKVIAHEAGLHVLTAPRDLPDAGRIDPAAVRRTLASLAQPYEYIVADLAHDLRENTLEMARGAATILHLMSADAVSVQQARKALAAYPAAGIRPENVLLLLVDSRPGQPAHVGDVELAVGRPVSATIPYVSQMADAINRGLPFVDAFPDHRLTYLLEDLAYSVSKPAHKAGRPATPSPAYDRVRARAAAGDRNGSIRDALRSLKQARVEG